MAYPTYGELIELLTISDEKSTNECLPLCEVLAANFSGRYPAIYIGRANRFLDTVQRIAAPTKQSTGGRSKLEGDSLRSYMKRTWKPRIRNTTAMSG